MTILRMTEEEYADHTRGDAMGESESSRTAASNDTPPVIHLTLSVGLYAVLIEELGFLRCVAGHEHNADVLRRTLYHAGGVREVEKLS